MPPKNEGAKHRVFPAAIYEESSNVQDEVMPFEACEFAQYFLNNVPDLLSSKHSLEFKYACLTKKIRETHYYDSSWREYKVKYSPLIKKRIDSEFYKLKHSYCLLSINFSVSLIALAFTSKEAQQIAFGYGLVSFCLLVNLKYKLNVIHDTYSILEDLNKTHFSLERETKKINTKKALSAFFNKIKILNNFKSNNFFDSYKYYLCSPLLNRFEHPHVNHINKTRLHNFYDYFTFHSKINYNLDLLDSIVDQLSEVTLKKLLFYLLSDLIENISNKEDAKNLSKILKHAMDEESLDNIIDFLALYEQLNRFANVGRMYGPN